MGVERERYLCAMPTPHLLRFCFQGLRPAQPDDRRQRGRRDRAQRHLYRKGRRRQTFNDDDGVVDVGCLEGGARERRRRGQEVGPKNFAEKFGPGRCRKPRSHQVTILV